MADDEKQQHTQNRGSHQKHQCQLRIDVKGSLSLIHIFPTKVNVAVASSLATVGPEDTRVDIYSVPGMVGDDHKITSEIEGVKAVVDIYSSTSAIAGWSVVAVLQNIVSVSYTHLKAVSREKKEAEARRQFELKQQKKKEKHRGR